MSARRATAIYAAFSLLWFGGGFTLAKHFGATPELSALLHPFAFALLSTVLMYVLLRRHSRESVRMRAATDDAREISGRRAEEAETLWRRLVEQTLVGVYTIEDERFTYANEAALQMLGYSLEELQNLTSTSSLIDERDCGVAQARLRGRMTDANDTAAYHLRCVRRDGTLIVVEVFASAFELNGRQVAFGLCRDITAEVRAQEELERREEWFRLLIEGASDIIGVLTLDGVYTYCSPAVTAQLGYLQSDLVGRNAFEFIHQDDVERVRRELTELVDGVRPRTAVALRFRHAADGWRDFDVRLRISDMPEGGRMLICNSHDVTETRRMQQQFAASERLASLGRVASSMAHEFNNVLMGIQPFADVIARINDPQRLRTVADSIQNSVRRGKTITQQVLRFTRGDKPTRRSTSVPDLLRAVAEEFGALRLSNINVDATDPDTSLWVFVDREQVQQLLINLCLNARDAMPEGGRVELSADRPSARELRFGVLSGPPEAFVHIAVADSGVGIAAELQSRIFEPMFTTKKGCGGTGLGLSIAHQIALAHQGELFVESEVGKGSTFHLILPAAAASPMRRVTDRFTLHPSLRRVLVVEDDDDVAEAVLTALRTVGVAANHVSTGAAAISGVERFDPDVVLLDYGLPDMNGTAVYRVLRKRWPRLPILFATGQTDAVVLRHEIDDEQVTICLKPFEMSELLLKMAEVLTVTGV